jgi:ribonuclease P protein component
MSSVSFTRRQTLGSSERVKSKKLAEELFKKGSSFFLYPFIVRKLILTKDLVQKDTPASQLLIAVPKKKLRKAVDRNFVKRRVREAYRLNKYTLLDQLEDQQIAFSLVYVAGKKLDYHFLEEKIKAILERLPLDTEE